MSPANPLQLWTHERVREHLSEAADTLRRLPSNFGAKRLTFWPDVVHTSYEIWLAEAHARNKVTPPHPAAISRMDTALTWLLPLNTEQRRILWARSCGVSWRRLEQTDGRSHTTLRKIYAAGLDHVVRQANGLAPAMVQALMEQKQK
ncbi:MAG: DUF6362 family protein [Holosporales bacterium]|jgi:hypothetical protein